jgi:hypothetical protein
MRQRPKEESEKLKAEIHRLWEEDKSYTEIAVKLQISRSAVAGFVSRLKGKGLIKTERQPGSNATQRKPRGPMKSIAVGTSKKVTNPVGPLKKIARLKKSGPGGWGATFTDKCLPLPEAPLSAAEYELMLVPKLLEDLEQNDCRWIISNQGEAKFCAVAKKEGSSYCSHHHFRAYTPIKMKAGRKRKHSFA